MNRVELMQTRQALRSRLNDMERIVMSCEHCEHLTTAGLCGLFDERPPADALRSDIGCESWKYDEIPF